MLWQFAPRNWPTKIDYCHLTSWENVDGVAMRKLQRVLALKDPTNSRDVLRVDFSTPLFCITALRR